MRAPFSSLARHRDLGLLILRIGIGIMFIGHGLPKLLGGPDRWQVVGRSMGHLGVSFAPTFWGFMAAVAEAGGGVLLIVGLFTRAACLLLAFTMLVAAIRHLKAGDAFFGGASHAIEALILFASLFFIGPGKYSVDKS